VSRATPLQHFTEANEANKGHATAGLSRKGISKQKIPSVRFYTLFPLFPSVRNHGLTALLTSAVSCKDNCLFWLKTRHPGTIQFHGFAPHGMRSDPEAMFAIEGPIHHQRLQRFGMAADGDDFVFAALVMPVKPRAGFDRQGRKRISGSHVRAPRWRAGEIRENPPCQLPPSQRSTSFAPDRI